MQSAKIAVELLKIRIVKRNYLREKRIKIPERNQRRTEFILLFFRFRFIQADCLVDSGRHVRFARVNGKMYKGAFFECEDEIVRTSVVFVLMDRVFIRLSGERIFEFYRHDRDTIDSEYGVDAVCTLEPLVIDVEAFNDVFPEPSRAVAH